MIWPRNPFSARPSGPARPSGSTRFKFSSGAWLALAWALGVILVGCAAPAEPAATPDYPATIQLLLPTAEPTEPPAPTAMLTPQPLTDAAPPTDTPAPTASLRPTYTPRPLPTQAEASEREPSIPFQASLLDGTDLLLADTMGAPTLLAFWAPW